MYEPGFPMEITLRFGPGFQRQSAPQRPLAVALLIATAVHAFLLLFARVDFFAVGPRKGPRLLEITLLRKEQELQPQSAEALQEERDPQRHLLAPGPTITVPSKPPQPTRPSEVITERSRAPIDWQTMAEQAAENVIAENAELERRRAEMWRRTRSVMFAPSPNVLFEDEPYLPNLSFDNRRFKGIGFEIGEKCYFGIPADSREEIDSDASDILTTGMRRSGIGLIQCEVDD